MKSKYFIFLLFPFIVWCQQEEDGTTHIPSTPEQGLPSLLRASAGQFQYNNTISVFYTQKAMSIRYLIEATYGISDSFALSAGTPIVLKNTLFEKKSGGLSDIFFKAEWTFFSVPAHIGLLKGSIKFPTGDANRRPFIATGTYDYFIELDTIHSSEKWYAEGLLGVKINGTKINETKFGSGPFFSISWGPKFPLTDKLEIDIIGRMSGFAAGLPSVSEIETGNNVILLGPLVSLNNEWDTGESFVTLVLFQVPISQKILPGGIKAEFFLSLEIQYNF